ncbi:DUF1330 domain-containing protein [Ruegeria sp. HKCCD6604]|uniref:DUF1330 domain-containing protein n=1 Tax=Ruegeria sp. HKCCD6604 TaxID=2683000 RepID=UPI0014918B1F|nr:DUF1330 domain-containing protein [Ruegeria sp. HKCCD6604]NOC92869.1 DUF1330 domain-containing protein [Ruegeria sp. HKCCD6604]
MTSYIDPDRDQFEAFKALDRDMPIEMLNLVKFRAKAQYPTAHELVNAGLTGAQAYRSYGAETAPIIERIGARILWRGVFEATLIGPADEAWDSVFIARYPTAHAFLEMVTDPVYRAAVIHRQAAVETSRLIRCGSGEAGATFG